MYSSLEGAYLDPAKSQTTAQTLRKKSPVDEMSDSELLRKIAKHSEESAYVLKRFLFFAQCFAAIWILDKVLLLFFS